MLAATALKGTEEDAPEDFFCPISQELMRDPVTTSDGHTYERSAIEDCLGGACLANTNLTPNIALRKAIVEWEEKHLSLKELELEQEWQKLEMSARENGRVRLALKKKILEKERNEHESMKQYMRTFGAWYTKLSVLSELNEVHGDFRWVFFEHFHALLEETNDEAFVCRMADYVRCILSKYMFVRVERPSGSKHFVLGYVKCDWVFSFAPRFERMRMRLNRVPPTVLTDVESGENKALRLTYVGKTDCELTAIAAARRKRFEERIIRPLPIAKEGQLYGKIERLLTRQTCGILCSDGKRRRGIWRLPRFISRSSLQRSLFNAGKWVLCARQAWPRQAFHHSKVVIIAILQEHEVRQLEEVRQLRQLEIFGELPSSNQPSEADSDEEDEDFDFDFDFDDI